MIEDVRNVSGSLERFLLDRGETVVRLAPRLMADARRGMRTRGKSDPIDALAIARAAAGLYDQLTVLVKQVAPQLLAERGIGVLLAAKFIGEIAGIDRFTTDAQLARLAGCAPIPVSSGRSDHYRLDPGGNRQLNCAFHLLAIIRVRHDPRTAVYLAKQRANGKTNRDAIRSLKRHLVRRVFHLLRDPQQRPSHDLLDIGGSTNDEAPSRRPDSDPKLPLRVNQLAEQQSDSSDRCGDKDGMNGR